MNLKQRLAGIKKSDPAARKLSDVIPDQISRVELARRSDAALQRDMKARNLTDETVLLLHYRNCWDTVIHLTPPTINPKAGAGNE